MSEPTRSGPHELPSYQRLNINLLGIFKKACATYEPTSYCTEYLLRWSKNALWTPLDFQTVAKVCLTTFTVENVVQR